ncbi:MAG: ATP-binding cassette domain-containing protein [Bernardetiaceae bacterium]|nr:ATP-binding cassette domain-containing protein [Bernardetiaceae bacterium]
MSIRAVNIKKSFGDIEVLKGVSADFVAGQTNLIIGSSGTGKSVFLKCIVGLFPINEGEIFYGKRNFHQVSLDEQKKIRTEIGMLFQGGALFDSKTVFENTAFPLIMRAKMSKSEMEDRVMFCLKRVGLEKAAHKMPSEISGGMKKRVGIARAIVMQPDFLFCDEPNSGLDPQTAIMIDELIRDITHENNMTTVIVTHDMNSVMTIGEHVIFLADGYKVWEGQQKDILDTDVKKLNDFVFTGVAMQKYKNG